LAAAFGILWDRIPSSGKLKCLNGSDSLCREISNSFPESTFNDNTAKSLVLGFLPGQSATITISQDYRQFKLYCSGITNQKQLNPL
jgi:hypothetical protein